MRLQQEKSERAHERSFDSQSSIDSANPHELSQREQQMSTVFYSFSLSSMALTHIMYSQMVDGLTRALEVSQQENRMLQRALHARSVSATSPPMSPLSGDFDSSKQKQQRSHHTTNGSTDQDDLPSVEQTERAVQCMPRSPSLFLDSTHTHAHYV